MEAERAVAARYRGGRKMPEPSELIDRQWFIQWRGARWGFESSRVWGSYRDSAEPYLDRYILYFWPITLRLHRFWRGDDDRAPHDHPWWFITIPFTSYVEAVYEPFSE